MLETAESYLKKYLENVPLFCSLNDEHLGILYNAGNVKEFNKNITIFHQGSPGDTFYVIVSGRVKITLLSEDGKEIILSILKEGDFFGEMSIFDNEIRSANAIVIENAVMFVLNRNRFQKLIATNSDIVGKIIKEICARLRCADQKIGSLAFLNVYGRVIWLLQQFAHEQGQKTKKGIRMLNAPTHQEIASMVGASRETVTRVIKLLKDNMTIIYYHDREIILKELTNISSFT